MRNFANLGPEMMRCPQCRYQLRGTVAAARSRCPECGYRFTIDELRAIAEDDRLRLGHQKLLRTVGVATGYGLAAVTLTVVTIALFLVVAWAALYFVLFGTK